MPPLQTVGDLHAGANYRLTTGNGAGEVGICVSTYLADGDVYAMIRTPTGTYSSVWAELEPAEQEISA